MASETQYAGSCSNSDYAGNPAWVSTSSATGSQNGTNSTVSLGGGSETQSDWLVATINNFSVSSGALTSVAYGVYSSYGGAGATGGQLLVQVNDGGGWCSGHTETLGTSGVWETGTCSHHSWNFTNIDSMQIRARILNASYSLSFSGRIDAFRGVVNYSTCTTPGSPGAPSFSSVTDTSITVNKPSNPTGSPTEWRARQTDDSWTSSWTAVGTTTVVNSGLTAGTSYTYDTQFRDTASCEGAWGTNASQTTDNVPSQSADPTLGSIGGTSITGTKPTNPSANGDSITHWQFRLTTSSGGSGTSYPTTPSDIAIATTTNQVTGLSLGTPYYGQVRFKNGVGYGAWSAGTVNATTDNVPGAPGTPTLDSRTTTSITVDWTAAAANGSTISDYDLEWRIWDGTFASINAGLDLTEQVSGLVQNSEYDFKVHATNGVGDGGYSGTAVFYTVPSTPTGLTITANAVGQLAISWSSVASDWTTGSTTYDLEYSTNGSTKTGDVLLNSGLTSTSQSSLGNGTQRWYRVRAKNTQVDSSFTSWTSGTTWTVASAQNLVSATQPEGSMIRVTRNGTYPTGSGTPIEPVDSWEVWRSSSSSGSYTEIDNSLTATTYDDWSVNGGETWYYKGKFTNLVGDSALSAAAVSGTATAPEIDFVSDTRIRDTFEITKTSDTVILREEIDTQTKTSNVVIRIPDNDLPNILSDAVIQVLDNNLPDLSSDSAVYRPGFDTKTKTANSAIFQSASVHPVDDNTPFAGTLGVDYFGHLDISSDNHILVEQTTISTSDSSVLKIGEISRITNTNISSSGLSFTINSDSAVRRIDFDIINTNSNTRINRDGFDTNDIPSFTSINIEPDINVLSDSSIYREAFDRKEFNSDSRIVNPGTFVASSLFSNSHIRVADIEITTLSDSFIIYNIEITTLSDSTIFSAGYGLKDVTSDSAIFESGLEITISSDSSIFLGGIDITLTSDTVIRRPAGYKYPYQRRLVLSNSRIETTYEVMFK